MNRLQGKRILVTGASRGLGRALCQRFATEGADVAFSYHHDMAGAQKTVDVITQAGQRALSYQANVTEPNAMREVVADIVGQWGGVDILVNNAGISQALPLALMEESDWDKLLEVNLKGTYICARAVLPQMVRRKSGVILNMGSLAGTRMISAPIHYCASKAGVRGFTEALAKEVGRYQIRVNCLAPGLLEEGVAQNLPQDKLNDYLNQVALHRVGKLDEVADYAAFLVSDDNSYMTGATLLIDGGL